jgi:hypothetical protein
MTATNQDFRVYAGDSAVLDVTLSTADGTPLQLDDTVHLKWLMTRYPQDESKAVIVKTLGDGIEKVDAGVAISLVNNDTAGLPFGAYRHELKIWNGPDTNTAMVGTAVIMKCVRMGPPGSVQQVEQAQATHTNRIALTAWPVRAV